MKRCDFWKLGLLNVLASPVRSLLTVLGMAIGVGAILAVLTLGDAGKYRVENEMMRLGIDKVWLTADAGDSLLHGDAAALSDALRTAVTEQAYGSVTVASGTKRTDGVVVGCSEEYLRLMDATITQGRALHPLEWQAGSRAVLLGQALYRELAPQGSVSVGGMSFRVAGAVSLGNQLSTIDGDRAVFLPIDVFCELMGARVAELTVSVPKGSTPDKTASQAVAALSRRERSATAVTMQLQIDAANTVMDIFVNVLKWVAAICILVGGIGVMNILLVSVRERRREIGVMKSLGADDWQVCGMFLLEALLYAAIGGVGGVLTGVGLIALSSRAIGLQASIKSGDMACVVLAAVAVGLFFGVVPALRAARLSPVDALRE